MKVFFIYDEKNDKYNKLAKELYSYFLEKDSEIKISNMLEKSQVTNGREEFISDADNKSTKVYKTKSDLYIFFSDSSEELQQNYDKFKRPKRAMIITENLTVEYIMLCVDIAKNICYSKKDLSDICSRIEATYEKYMDE